MKSRAFGLLAGAALAGCTGTTPPRDIPSPDLDLVTVFFPVDGLVRGRALEGAVPDNVTHVLVRAHPTGTKSLATVASDGGFEFGIVAISGNILELIASNEREDLLGEPGYVEVPATPFPRPDYVCCMPTGTCQTRTDRDDRIACPTRAPGISNCEIDEDCGVLEGELYELDLSKIQVTAPNAQGRIAVTGVVPPNVLVVLENRGLRNVGGHNPGIRVATISKDTGAFTFPSVAGQGDDELVFRFLDLNGIKSPQISRRVPDAVMGGLDILGAFAWEPLTNNSRGRVAVHLSPYGVDGKGICPDTNEDPILCVGGGLTHSMANFTRITIDDAEEPINPSITSTTPTLMHNRGTEGDVRSGPQDIFLAIDLSAEAEAQDGDKVVPARRFEAIARFIQGLRRRDRVGVVVFGDTTEVLTAQPGGNDFGLRSFDERAALVQAVRELGQRDHLGASNVFRGIEKGGAMLRAARTRRGRVVAITAAEPVGDREAASASYRASLGVVSENPNTGSAAIGVYIVGINIVATDKFQDFEDITFFTEGDIFPSSIDGLEQTLTELRSALSGNFILLYDMFIPDRVGKAGVISFTVEVVLGGDQRAQASYEGPIRVLNSSNN